MECRLSKNINQKIVFQVPDNIQNIVQKWQKQAQTFEDSGKKQIEKIFVDVHSLFAVRRL